ncbi:SET and MYND domain-containing protein [Pseudolycoriella hygida]|uniref:SET and MYND domain-containing protein n=1 Tax=Pseudolycoriella hygida TaxID=35572 RepID=A0A9Q0S6W9_9DIPT|nr:SET and MYND domain-containing protein [Pseudolycoriella hygida]
MEFKRTLIDCIDTLVKKHDFQRIDQPIRNEFIFEYLCSHLSTKNVPLFDNYGKNILISKVALEIGNSVSIGSNYDMDHCIEMYTKSIAYAPNHSLELPVCYTQRSSVLYDAKLVSDALADINRALSLNSASMFKSRLYARKALYLITLNASKDEIMNAWFNAESLLSEIGEDDKHIVMEELEMEESNSLVPELSDAVELRYNRKYGRHIVAKRDIAPGETIAIAKPYAKIVYLNMRYKVCWQCGKQTFAGLPCKKCVEVIFCSELCRQQAIVEHHDIECPLLEVMKDYEMENCFFMSLRLVIKAFKEAQNSIEILWENITKIDEDCDHLAKGFIGNVHASNRFESVYSLQSNFNEWLPHQARILADCFLIAYYLGTMTNFFGHEIKGGFDAFQDDEEFLFIVNLLQMNVCLSNTNSSEFACDYKGERIGMFQMIVPALAFFNHSCDLMVIRNPQQDSSVFMTSLVPIQQGEQVFDNYGHHFVTSSKQNRMQELKRKFHFTCYCTPCRQNYEMDSFSSRCSTSKFASVEYALRHICDKLTSTKEIDPGCFSLKRILNHPPANVRLDIDILIKTIYYCWKEFPPFAEEVLKAIRCLEICIRLSELPFITINEPTTLKFSNHCKCKRRT